MYDQNLMFTNVCMYNFKAVYISFETDNNLRSQLIKAPRATY